MTSMSLLRAAVLLLIAMVPSTHAASEAWPQRAVRVIVPNPPGISNDVIARLFAEELSARWGQPVIVENLPGPDGLVAAREFVSRRDDHTLLYSFASLLSVNPITIDKLPYDPARDIIPIASTSDNFIAIAVPNALGVSSLADLAQVARNRSGKMTFAATPGVPFYAITAFLKEAGLEMAQVHYRNFNQAVTDLGEGRIDVAAVGVIPLLPQVQAGKIRLLALVNGSRSPAAPDVPTASEQGYRALLFSAVTGFFGWRDMPSSIRDKIAADVGAVAQNSVVRDRLAKLGSLADAKNSAGFAAAIEAQHKQISAIAGGLKKLETPKP
jgi:tripartite-type tricarboxylate transporter receptor subunit TctC